MKALLSLFFAAISAFLTFAPFLHAEEEKTLKIRIGTEGAYPPFNSLNAHNQLEGFEIDYFNALCDKIMENVTCSWTTQDWDGIIPALLAGKYDMIVAAMNATKKRAEIISFSTPYVRMPSALIAPKKIKAGESSPIALTDKMIGVQTSTVHAKYAQKYYTGSDVRLYPTQHEATFDLVNGRVDYVLSDQSPLEEFLAKDGKKCCHMIATLPYDPSIHGPGFAVALRKEDKALLEKVNAAIKASINSGLHKKIAEKWFNFPLL